MIFGTLPHSVLPLSSLYDYDTTDSGQTFDFFAMGIGFNIVMEKPFSLHLVEFEPNTSTFAFTLQLERNPEIQLDV